MLFLERCLNLLAPGGRLGIVVPDGVLNNPSLKDLREYVEDRARIIAVVSIPDKTFRSAKTAVKASLLFLRKLTNKEAMEREKSKKRAIKEELERLQPELDSLTRAIKVTYKQYAKARSNNNEAGRDATNGVYSYESGLDESAFKNAQKKARDILRELQKKPTREGRLAVRIKHDYDIFMAVAEHVGIRASGKTDPENELPDILDSWRKYLNQPDSIPVDVTKALFKIQWSKLDRWDPSSFRPIEWQCSNEFLRPIGQVLKKRFELVDRDEVDFSDLTPITIHFDGSVEPRDMTDTDDYTMDLFFAKPGDIVLSKIDLKNGAVGIIPDSLTNVVVTSHFVVYEPVLSQVYPPYLIRLIQTRFFKDYLWRKKVGSEGRKEVKLDLFESTGIPLPPDVEVQKVVVAEWVRLEEEKRTTDRKMEMAKKRLETLLIRGGADGGRGEA